MYQKETLPQSEALSSTIMGVSRESRISKSPGPDRHTTLNCSFASVALQV